MLACNCAIELLVFWKWEVWVNRGKAGFEPKGRVVLAPIFLGPVTGVTMSPNTIRSKTPTTIVTHSIYDATEA
jgi:hypothetical protein